MTIIAADAPSRFLKAKDVSKLTSLSAHTIYLLAHDGEFPRPVKLTQKRIAWRESEVFDWMKSRETAA